MNFIPTALFVFLAAMSGFGAIVIKENDAYHRFRPLVWLGVLAAVASFGWAILDMSLEVAFLSAMLESAKMIAVLLGGPVLLMLPIAWLNSRKRFLLAVAIFWPLAFLLLSLV